MAGVGLVIAARIALGGDAESSPEVWRMHRKPVDSSAISSVGYDPRSEVLEIEFGSGAVYDYFNVPPAVYDALMKASSKGSFVSHRIRGCFPFVRLAR
jgi:hypothetical protein